MSWPDLRTIDLRGVAVAYLVILMCATTGPAGSAAPHPSWGRIANAPRSNEPPLAAVYFGGPANPAFLPIYTRHPVDSSQSAATWKDADRSLSEVSRAGVNTLILSYWGHDGETDRWSPSLLFSKRRWPGDGAAVTDYTEAEQVERGLRFFRRAASHNLLISPLLEVSPKNPFWKEFPADLDNLVNRSSWLLKHFGEEPNWLQMFDQQGKPRRVLWLIETIHGSRIDPKQFAAGFEGAAERIRKATGYAVGFVVDPTPLPAYGSHEGPDPAAMRPPSVLAVNPFNITSQGVGEPRPQRDLTDDDRLAYAEQVLTRWADSGIPLITPVTPGYDARLVFPEAGIYGFSDRWLRRQRELALRFGTGGINIDCWNGWTEGYAIPPSKEEGDRNLRWVRSLLRDIRAAR